MAVFPFTPSLIADNEDPFLIRTAWDTVQLGEFTLPGISTVSVTRSRNYQIKKPKDKSYAQIKDTGLDLAKVTITNVIGGISYYIPNDSVNKSLLPSYQGQLDILENILQYFETKLGIKTKSKSKTGNEDIQNGFAANHPALQMRGIESLYITSIDGPSTSRGLITTTFNCIETKAVKNTVTKSVVASASFASGSAFSSSLQQPVPPSQNPNATGPKTR